MFWHGFLTLHLIARSRKSRQHIHFASAPPPPPSEQGKQPGQQRVLSGARADCEVLIFVDAAAAMADGYIPT
jgi:hypothetical protein